MSPLLILLVFFVYSCGYNIYGVIASDIVAGLRLEAGNAGLLISTYQIGAAVSLAISPFLIRRLKSGGLLRFGLIIQIIGFGLVFFLPTKVAALAAFIALGLGGFYIDSGSNSYIADNYPEKKERLIPLLHFTYSAGALVCGYMVLPFKNQGNWNVAYGIAGLIMAVILFASFQKPKSHSSIPVESLSEKGSIKTLLTDPDFIMYCIVILCYGSAQQICSSWFPYYMENVLFAEPVIIATAGTCLWVGIAASRLLGSFILAKGVNPLAITTYGMLTSFITQLLAVATSNIPFTLAMMAVCGFASGAVIPFFIVDVNNWYPGMGRLTSVMYILSITLGRMIFPYLVTYVSSSVGLRSSLALFSLIFLSGSILAFIVKRRRISK